VKTLDACYERLIEAISTQPQVFMHRDYHSANLMVLKQDVGILDFQDAFIGPVTYDLASLLRDCYIAWPDEQVTRWVQQYWRMQREQGLLNNISEDQFMRMFDWMSVQRHLKALMTFARKHVRDQQSSYLQHIPRTLNYLQHVTSRYPELTPMHRYLSEVQTCVR
jgi:aminoglycoside/choline kinase family phosphotransferase